MHTTIPSSASSKKAPWNKGHLIGQKRPLKPKDVWAIRVRLQLEGRKRDLALFNLAIDSRRLSGSRVIAELPGIIGDSGRAVVLSPQYPPGDRPAMHLGGAVVDAEGADLTEQAGDDRVVGDAEPAQDLHAAVDDAPDRLRPPERPEGPAGRGQITSRLRWISISLSASMKPTPSCSPIGLPKAVRRRA
jgi:hypothetical protein